MPQALAQLIRERRQDLGLTQEELAERMGGSVRQAEVSRLESGNVKLPRRPRMEDLARALEVPIGELLLRSGWPGAEEVDRQSPPAPSPQESAFSKDANAEHQPSVADLEHQNARLVERMGAIQRANNLLRERAFDRAMALQLLEASVYQLQAVLDALSDSVVVVDEAGVIVVENAAYADFSIRYTDTPALLDPLGQPIPDAALPLERAARGEQFRMSFADR